MNGPSFEDMSDEELVRWRDQLSKSNPNYQYLQDQTAPLEHKGYVRDSIRTNPLLAPLMAGAIPAYDAQKFLHQNVTKDNPLLRTPIPQALPAWAIAKLLETHARSKPSLDSLFQGYKGIGQGLSDWFTK